MPSKETELVLYVQLEDPGFTLEGKSEYWFQYETEFKNGTRARVRQYHEEDSSEITRSIATIKAKSGKTAGVDTVDEYNCEITEDFAEGFIHGSETVQHKRRDYLKSNKVAVLLTRGGEEEVHDAPELPIDFDRFINDDGTFQQWAKVDIEIDEFVKWLDSTYGLNKIGGIHVDFEHLIPTKVLKIIHSKTTDPEEKQILDDLWDNKLKKKLSS